MKEQVLWISGWASDLEIWSEEIQRLWPQYRHDFWDYAELIKAYHDPQLLARNIRSDYVIGWSLGSHWLLNHLALLPLKTVAIAVAPVASFCAKPGGWAPRILNRMIQKISCQPEGVLEAFSEQLGCPDPQKWVKQALQYDSHLLVQGLEILRDSRLDFSLQRSIQVFQGDADRIVSPQLLTSWKSYQMEGSAVKIISEMQHWPLTGFPIAKLVL